MRKILMVAGLTSIAAVAVAIVGMATIKQQDVRTGDPLYTNVSAHVVEVGDCKVLRCAVVVKGRPGVFGPERSIKDYYHPYQMAEVSYHGRIYYGRVTDVGQDGSTMAIFMDDRTQRADQIRPLTDQDVVVSVYGYTS